jgi:hypothetical protein
MMENQILFNAAQCAIDADRKNIENVSFTPTRNQVDDLIAQSKLAEKSRFAMANGNTEEASMSLLTKISTCFPKSGDPNDTILCKLGSGKIAENAPYVGDRKSIVVIGNPTMTLGSTSNGPNCVLTDCQDKYGKNVMNLFHIDVDSTKKLLTDVINMTENRKNDIFALFVNILVNHQKADYVIKNTDPNGEKLDKDYREHYDNVVEMMKLIKENGGPSKYGFEILRYCQTWLRGGRNATVGEANFSIPSPHFQIRFYAKDANKLVNIPGININHFESYCILIKRFNDIMSPEYGGTYGPAFININGLNKLLHVPVMVP